MVLIDQLLVYLAAEHHLWHLKLFGQLVVLGSNQFSANDHIGNLVEVPDASDWTEQVNEKRTDLVASESQFWWNCSRQSKHGQAKEDALNTENAKQQFVPRRPLFNWPPYVELQIDLLCQRIWLFNFGCLFKFDFNAGFLIKSLLQALFSYVLVNTTIFKWNIHRAECVPFSCTEPILINHVVWIIPVKGFVVSFSDFFTDALFKAVPFICTISEFLFVADTHLTRFPSIHNRLDESISIKIETVFV